MASRRLNLWLLLWLLEVLSILLASLFHFYLFILLFFWLLHASVKTLCFRFLSFFFLLRCAYNLKVFRHHFFSFIYNEIKYLENSFYSHKKSLWIKGSNGKNNWCWIPARFLTLGTPNISFLIEGEEYICTLKREMIM